MIRIINRKEVYEYKHYKEIEIYPVYSGSHKRVRCEKRKESKKSQKELNKRNRIKKILRLLRDNFCKKDFFVTLTYSEKNVPKTVDGAQEDYKQFMRALRKAYSDAGKTLKYMAWVEKGVEKGRLHHHLVVSGGIDREVFEELFQKGFVTVRKLKPELDDFLSLAEYFAKEPKGKRTFTCSKNLSRTALVPKVVENNKTSKQEIKAIIENFEDKEWFEKKYPGYEPVFCDIRKNEYSRHSYIYLTLRKKGCYDYDFA